MMTPTPNPTPARPHRPRLSTWLALITALWGLPLAATALTPSTACAQADPGPLIERLSAARFIPAESLYVGAFDGIQQAYDRLGIAAIATEYKAAFDAAAKEVEAAIGHNILDPAAWAALGIATQQPIGGALISLDDESGLLFASTSDGPLLAKNIQAISARLDAKLADRSPPGATLLCEDSPSAHACVAIRDAHVLIVISGKGAAEPLAKRLLKLSLPESFSGSPAYKSAAKALPAAQLVGILQPTQIQRHVTTQLKSLSADPELKRLTDALADAKKRKADDEVAYLTDNLTWHQHWLDRQTSDLKLIDRAFSGVAGAAFGLQAFSNSLEGNLTLQHTAAAFIADTFPPFPSTPKLYATLDDLPLVLATAHAKPDKLVEVISLLVTSEGGSMDEVTQEAKAKLGIDLRADVFSALSGEVGIAVTADIAAALASRQRGEDPSRHFGGSITIGFKDHATLTKLLDKLTAHPVASKLMTPAGDRWVVDNPWRKVWFGALNGTLLITTDEAAFARLATTSPAFLDKLTNPALKDLLSRKDTSAALTFHSAFIPFLSALYQHPFIESPTDLPAGSTPEQKRARADLIALQKQLATLYQERDRATQARIMTLATLIGPQALTLHTTPTQSELRGGMFFTTPSFAALVKACVKVGVETANDMLNEEISALINRRWELERILYDY